MSEGQIPVGGYVTGNTPLEFDVEGLRRAHRVLATYEYEQRPISRGYAGRTLHVDLSRGTVEERPVTEAMKRKFTGGRGFGLKILWDDLKPTTRWDDDDNVIVFTNGVLCGITQYPGTGKSICLTVSPSTGIICDSNVGGFFGPYLKFSGFDALAIRGIAHEDVIMVVDGVEGRVSIETAPLEDTNTHVLAEQLARMYAKGDTPRDLQMVSSMTSGAGAEHSYWGCMNSSFYDIRRGVPRVKQAGRGGLGTVLRHKRVKAIVVISPRVTGTENGPADLEMLTRVGTKMHREIAELDRYQCHMRAVGTAHLTEIMNAYDLLPCENYRFGSFPKAPKLASTEFFKRFTKVIPDGCWHGCTMACSKTVDGFELRTGPYKGTRVTVDGPEYETVAGCANMSIWEPDWVLEFNFYCDTYGLDTISTSTAIAFYMEMYEYGILNKVRCDGLELRFGNADAVMEFLHRLAAGDDGPFMSVAPKGIRRVKDWLIANGWGDPRLIEDCGMESKGLEYSEYVTKESLAMQGGYGLTLKGPQHDEAWLIFMDMVNNAIPTFEDKAEALHYFPMWRTWFGLHGLCKLPWNDVEPADNAETDEPAKVPEHVQNYVDIVNAVTGLSLTKEDLILQSERCYNWQRAMNVWMGRGRRADDWVPYRSMGPVTDLEYLSRQDRYDAQLVEILGLSVDEVRAMPVSERIRRLYEHRRNEYEKLTDAVYYRRGWTPNGVPTPHKMRALGFGDETEMLEFLKRVIAEDDAAGLNVWGGVYGEGESTPDPDQRYWEKW